ncbi:sex-lethal homolog [Drosophila eugracilis]|uniref:sex-lethal homolog n=1 Tax=Drosophila eugracilis TaxID=29029 RepID=UPI0007E74CBB|nr:sex-lethal homolog [Drosophila eugracilis]
MEYQRMTSTSGSSTQTLFWSFAGHGMFQTGSSALPRDYLSEERGDQTNLIINYMPQDMNEPELRRLFNEYGEIRKHRIIRHAGSGLSCCYGFVDFISPRQATAAQQSLDGTVIRGKRLKVSFARRPGDELKNCNLYVAHLPSYINEKILREMFSVYGNVLDVNVMRNKITREPTGVAFIKFGNHREAELAKYGLDRHNMEGGNRPIKVKFVDNPKNSKQNHTSNGLQFKYLGDFPQSMKRRQGMDSQEDFKRSR